MKIFYIVFAGPPNQKILYPLLFPDQPTNRTIHHSLFQSEYINTVNPEPAHSHHISADNNHSQYKHHFLL